MFGTESCGCRFCAAFKVVAIWLFVLVICFDCLFFAVGFINVVATDFVVCFCWGVCCGILFGIAYEYFGWLRLGWGGLLRLQCVGMESYSETVGFLEWNSCVNVCCYGDLMDV